LDHCRDPWETESLGHPPRSDLGSGQLLDGRKAFQETHLCRGPRIHPRLPEKCAAGA